MRPSKNILLIVTILGIALYSCENKISEKSDDENKIGEFDLKAAKAEILNKTNRFTNAHIIKDTAFLNNSFAENAKIFPPNSEIVTGRKAIAKLNSEWVEYGIHEFKEESSSTYGNENCLVDEGSYYLRYGNENIIDKGKYINVWKKVNGDWKIYSNIWNTNLPLE